MRRLNLAIVIFLAIGDRTDLSLDRFGKDRLKNKLPLNLQQLYPDVPLP
ncbi:hypothetical protein [Chamaesiphon sp.]